MLVGDSSATGAVQYCWSRDRIVKPAGKWLQEHAELRSFWTLPTVHVCSQRLRRFQNRSVYLELRRGGSPSRAALSGGCLSPHPDVPGLRQAGQE